VEQNKRMDENDDLQIEIAEELQVDEQWEKTFQKHGVLIVQNCPVGLEFGIDINSYESGPNFQGISMIPEGLHLIYFGTINSPRDGIFFSINPSCRLLFKIWDDENHTFVDGLSTLTDEGVLNLRKTILSGQFNEKLAPYPLAQLHVWRNLSLYIDADLLQRCNLPLNTTFTIQENIELTPKEQKLLGKLSFGSTQDNPLHLPVPQVTSFQEIESKYIENHFYELSLHPNKLNEMKLDKTYLIDHLLQANSLQINWFFGELQLSFLLFLFLISLSSLNSWKYLLSMLVNSENYWKTHKKHFKQLLQIFFYQLKFLSHDFLENEISKETFLLPVLSSLFTILNSMTSSLVVNRTISVWDNNNDEDEEVENLSLRLTTGNRKEERSDLEDILELQIRLNKFLFKKFNITFYQHNTEIPATTTGNEKDHSSSYIEERMIAQSASPRADDFETDEEGTRVVSKRLLSANDDDDNNTIINMQVADDQQQQSSSLHGAAAMETVDLSHINLTSENREELQFNWRYPLLSDAMKASHGQEDLLMTAMRILDETEEKSKEVQDEDERRKDPALLLRNEAITFISNEVQFLHH
jgi:A1 cistron-splicing factor AAR2